MNLKRLYGSQEYKFCRLLTEKFVKNNGQATEGPQLRLAFDGKTNTICQCGDQGTASYDQ